MKQFRLISEEKWPNPRQRLLLRAALNDPDDALLAWRQWNHENDIERIDSASFFVLPQVYRNLKQFQNDAPEYDRLKGVYRWTWSQNQITLAGLTDILGKLSDANIQTIVLKGVPLALNHYRDIGGRMMKDADLLVNAENIHCLIGALSDSDWRQEKPPSESLIPYLEAIHYVHPRWNLIDIHWRPFRLDTPATVEGKLNHYAVDTSINGVATRYPSATDMLLLTCFHARKSDLHSVCRWIADSVQLIGESGAAIDWRRLVEYSHELGVLLPVRDALTYLNQQANAPVPAKTLEHAWSLPTGLAEQRRYRDMIHHGINPSISHVLKEHWTRYGDTCHMQGRKAALAGFTRYFLSHCRREIRKDFVDLTKRFTWGRLFPS